MCGRDCRDLKRENLYQPLRLRKEPMLEANYRSFENSPQDASRPCGRDDAAQLELNRLMFLGKGLKCGELYEKTSCSRQERCNRLQVLLIQVPGSS